MTLYYEFKDLHLHSAPPSAFVGLYGDFEGVSQLEGQARAQELGVSYYEMAVDDLKALDLIIRSLSRKIIALKTS